MSTRSADSRENSPEHGHDAQEHSQDGTSEKRTSKKRKVLSCYSCRERKMKCDRVYPVCGRCQKTGRANQCTYDPRLQEEVPNGTRHVGSGRTLVGVTTDGGISYASPATFSSETVAWKLRTQERRIETLERQLASRKKAKNDMNSTPDVPDDSDDQTEPRFGEEMMFRGKGFKTMFYGSTSPFALIGQFTELQAFTREALFADTSMARIRTDIKRYRNQRKALLKEKGEHIQGTDAEILASLPDRREVEAAVTMYYHHFENTYRILHEGSFWKEYWAFWDPEQPHARTASFAVMLTLIVAITKCLVPDQETIFIGDSSAEREAALGLIDRCDAWLMRQSRKHLTLSFFQLQCLSLLAKRVNCLKMKQDWVNSGDLMRMAISAGLHRNPSIITRGRTSEFENEMRRRLWCTIAELELQSSIDSGLPSSVCGLYFDVQPPANIPDDTFAVESERIPAARPIEHFTRTSYLARSAETLPLRVQLTILLNDPTSNLTYEDVEHYDTQITTLISKLPKWEEEQAKVSRAILDIQLRQFLLILHRPYAKFASKNPRLVPSLVACVNSGSCIVDCNAKLLKNGIFTLNHMRSDTLRTVITLAQVVYHNSYFPPLTEDAATHASEAASGNLSPLLSRNHNASAPDTATTNAKSPPPRTPLRIPSLPTDNFLFSTLIQSSIQVIEHARSIFEEKVTRLGTGYMEQWLMAAAIGIMPSVPAGPADSHTTSSRINTGADDVKARGKKAIQHVTSLCFRVLAMQKDQSSEFARGLRNTVTGVSAESGGQGSVGNAGLSISNADAVLPPGTYGTNGVQSGMEHGMGMGMEESWNLDDGAQGMGADNGMWNFPEFWTFDLGGDF